MNRFSESAMSSVFAGTVSCWRVWTIQTLCGSCTPANPRPPLLRDGTHGPAGSLKQKLRTVWLPTPQQAAELTRVLAEAIQCAHDKKIVHRDLKPANILLKPDGTPKIVDFGWPRNWMRAIRSRQRRHLGTLSYMAPEAARGRPTQFRL